MQAIQKGNMENARIHGENAIRNKNQALNFRRMSARVDAVASRVQSAVTTQKVLHKQEYTDFFLPDTYFEMILLNFLFTLLY